MRTTPSSMRRSALALVALVIPCFLGFLVGATLAEEKIKVSNVDELPRHTYEIQGKASELLTNGDAFGALAERVRKDLESDLDKYEIEDKTTLQKYYNVLQTLAFLNGEHETALNYLERARSLEDKESQKLMMGMVSRAYVRALDADRDASSDRFKAAFQKDLSEYVKNLPWDVVQDQIRQLNGQMQIISEQLLIGMMQNSVDPSVEKAGFLSGDQVAQVISFRGALTFIIPLKDEIGAALAETIAANKTEKKNIWPARSVAFSGHEGYTPVMVAVWDSGVDVDVFADQRFTNETEKLDGVDNDDNGYVDDRHGIAYDLNHKKTVELILPLGAQAAQRDRLEAHLKGFMDLNAAIDSPEAAEIRKTVSNLGADEVKGFIEGLNLYAHHAHGTHVAGIAIEGNPYAQVLTARLTFDHHMVPQPFTKELARSLGREFKETVQYFKDNDVRVVNMSWVIGLKEIEDTLEKNGIGASAEERGKMAREMFDIVKNDLEEAFKNAPEILFVGGAGNSDNDVEFDQFIPPAFALPNLMIAGAVDQAGQATGFTSFGRTVTVYSNGFEVESYVPGGNRMKLSGTSMASPNVVNLAAKLLARDPKLTPPEVARLIVDGADDMGIDRPMLVINPKRSFELLEERHARR